jgi:hypothetical protein
MDLFVLPWDLHSKRDLEVSPQSISYSTVFFLRMTVTLQRKGTSSLNLRIPGASPSTKTAKHGGLTPIGYLNGRK